MRVDAIEVGQEAQQGDLAARHAGHVVEIDDIEPVIGRALRVRRHSESGGRRAHDGGLRGHRPSEANSAFGETERTRRC